MAVIFEPISFVGLDIGETQIRTIQLNHTSSEPSLVAAGSINLSTTEDKEKIDEGADTLIVEKIRQLIAEVGIVTENVVFSLPETEVFTRVIEVDNASPEEVQQAIEFEAESYVPYPIEEVQLDWQLLDDPNDMGTQKKMRALLVAAPLNVINRYVSLVEMAGLKPIAIETNTIGNTRSLIQDKALSESVAILDVGAGHSSLCIVQSGVIRLTHNIPLGGAHIRDAIARSLSVNEEEAEKLKLGLEKLDEMQRENVGQSYHGILDSMITEVRRSIDFYHAQSDSQQVKEILLCGRGSKLYGFGQYIAQNMGVEVHLADPWQRIRIQSGLSGKQLKEMAPAFSVAIGLAMRSEQ